MNGRWSRRPTPEQIEADQAAHQTLVGRILSIPMDTEFSDVTVFGRCVHSDHVYIVLADGMVLSQRPGQPQQRTPADGDINVQRSMTQGIPIDITGQPGSEDLWRSSSQAEG